MTTQVFLKNEVLSRAEACAKVRETEIVSKKAAIVAREGNIAERNATLSEVEKRVKSLEMDLLAQKAALAERASELAATKVALAKAGATAKTLEAEILATDTALAGVYASTCWRITEPLRAIKVAKQSGLPRLQWFGSSLWAWLSLKKLRQVVFSGINLNPTADGGPSWPIKLRSDGCCSLKSSMERTYRDSLYRARNQLEFDRARRQEIRNF